MIHSFLFLAIFLAIYFKEFRNIQRAKRKKEEGVVALTDLLCESEFTDKQERLKAIMKLLPN